MIKIPNQDFKSEEARADIGTCRGVGTLKEVKREGKAQGSFDFIFTMDKNPTKSSCDAKFTHYKKKRDTGYMEVLHITVAK